MEAASATVGRNSWVRAAQALLWTLIPAGAVMAQTVPFKETTSLSSDATPIESKFSIPQAGTGQYKITLTDVGALLPDPPGAAPLDSVHVVITRDATVVAKLDGNKDKTVAFSTAFFDATPGDYVAHITGKPGPASGSGKVGLSITNVASSSSVLNLSGALVPPQTTQPDFSSYQVEFDVATDADYTLTLADLKFPRAGALENAGAFLLQAGSSLLSACLSIPEVPPACPATKTVHLVAGHYTLVVAGGLLAGADAGVFAIHVESAAGNVLHSRRVELGSVKRVTESALSLPAGNHTLSLKDLLFPAALTAGKAMVATAATATAIVDVTTIDQAFTLAAPAAFDVFAYGTPDATSATGTFIVQVKPASGSAALSTVQAISDPATSARAYAFPIDIATAGTYRTKFGDFQFPVALSGSRIAVVQDGAFAGKTDAATGSSLSLDTPLVAGRASLLVLAKGAGTGALGTSGGTFGLEMALVGATTPLFETTQGIGGLVDVRKASVPADGRYDITLTDLDAPAPFNDLMLVISRGAQKFATLLVGGGSTTANTATYPDFNASVGNYSITLIATPNATEHASTYGLSMLPSPGAPTVTLNATPTTATSGTRVGLTWTSQNATSCVATSSPAGLWSGSKQLNGTDSSEPITAETTFTLRCQDAANRVTEKTVTVSVTAPSNNNGSGGGGGALDWLTIAALTLAGAAHLGRRRRRQMADL